MAKLQDRINRKENGITREHNHPDENKPIKVSPVRSLEMIVAIAEIFLQRNKLRDRAIWLFGVNVCLRASDILRITVGMIRNVPVNGTFDVREKKTKKDRPVKLNATAHAAIWLYLNLCRPNAKDHEPLFMSRKQNVIPKGGDLPGQMTVQAIREIIIEAAHIAGYTESVGSHTMRKTFGYIHRTMFGTDLPTLMKIYNHSSQEQTLTYVGIEEKEVAAATELCIG